MSAKQIARGVNMKVRYWGITEECTQCQCCGRNNLKRTVMLFILDADGNAEELTYYGTGCAAKAVGWTAAQVKKEAEQAQAWREKRVKKLSDIINIIGIEKAAKTSWSEWRRHNGLLLDGNFYHPDRKGFGETEFIAARIDAWKKEYADLAR